MPIPCLPMNSVSTPVAENSAAAATISTAVQAKLDALRHRLRELGSVLVCYSGGIDSAFMLAVAHEELGEKAMGMTAVSPSLAAFELEDAVSIATRIGARHELVESHELERQGYAQNGTDRCFHCKSELYTLSEEKVRAWGFSYAVNGTNLDDLGDYRPGLEAAKQAGVRSPLVETGFRKADVREAAKHIGLGVWDKPAAACLSSRIPYGIAVTKERLMQIGGFEGALRQLGFRELRVRWHALAASPGTREAALARVEFGANEVERAFQQRTAVLTAGKVHGFAFVTIDLAGYQQGSHNDLLSERPTSKALPILR
jgi:pyridinium-3,5-biscarboxylic acid mononucleotide sulfurtransferase